MKEFPQTKQKTKKMESSEFILTKQNSQASGGTDENTAGGIGPQRERVPEE